MNQLDIRPPRHERDTTPGADDEIITDAAMRRILVGMGVLPLQFPDGVGRESLKLKGSDVYTITNVAGLRPRQDVEVTLTREDGTVETFTARCRIDTVNELEYFLNGGILQYVLRKLAS